MKAIAISETFDGADVLAFTLDRKEQARTYGLVVDENSARAANAVFAPKVGTGQPAVLTDRVGECLSRFDVHRVGLSVDVERQIVLHASPSAARMRCRSRS